MNWICYRCVAVQYQFHGWWIFFHASTPYPYRYKAEEWETNLMSLAILFHFLCAQHVSDINTSIIRSLRLCCWITASVVFFCKDGWFSVSVNLQCIVVYVWCDVFCRFVVVGRCIFLNWFWPLSIMLCDHKA